MRILGIIIITATTIVSCGGSSKPVGPFCDSQRIGESPYFTEACLAHLAAEAAHGCNGLPYCLVTYEDYSHSVSCGRDENGYPRPDDCTRYGDGD